MAQGKIINVIPGEYGTVIVIKNLEGNEESYLYNKGSLTAEQLEKLIGLDISYGKTEGTKLTPLADIYKAWDENGKLIHSEIPFDGDDRSGR